MPTGIEMDWRALYFALNEAGEATDGMPGLCVPDEPATGMNGPGKGNCCALWLLEADGVGTGGEYGSAGY